MGIQNMTLLSGATVSATGGTTVNFAPDGVSVPNGVHVADSANADFKTRANVTLRTRNPQLVNGVFTKNKRWVTYVAPQVLSSGDIVFNLVRVEVEFHPDLAAADLTEMLKRGAQVMIDSDLATFWSMGSLS